MSLTKPKSLPFISFMLGQALMAFGSRVPPRALERRGNPFKTLIHSGQKPSVSLKGHLQVTKFNGQTWTQVAKVEIANTKLNENSSPCVAVFEGLLYLFYTSNSGIFWTSFDGNAWKTSWTQLRGVFVAPGTSPSAAVFNDKLYLFFNGIANDGTWYSTCFGGKFAVQPIPMMGTNGGMTFRPGTNPDAAVLNGGYLFRLFWVDDATQTVFYSDSVDGGNWKPQKKLSCDGEAPIPGKNTGVDMCLFKERPYMFWTSVSGGISVSQGFVWDI